MNPSVHTPEPLLISRCLAGEEKAQRELYDRYVGAMFHLVLRLVSVRAAAEDVLQEAFLRVFQHLHTFQGEATLGAWIRKITVHTAIQHLRRDQGILLMESVPESCEAEEDPFDTQSVQQSMKAIHEAILQLPAGCRAILTLHLLEGYQHQEIAQILRITESTSKTQYRRGKMLLREKLQYLLKEQY